MNISVAEIHKDFKETLAMNLMPVNSESSSKLDNTYYDNLKEIGFTNSSTYNKAIQLKEEDEKDQLKKETIKYFNKIQTMMPDYRMITFDNLLKLCKKYNLYFGNISKYIAVVPKENLEQIVKYKNTLKKIGKSFTHDISKVTTNMDITELYSRYNDLSEITNGLPYFIVAPQKDFEKDSVFVNRCLVNIPKADKFKLEFIELNDPIVVYPIFFKGTMVMHIPTAWGDEGDDELVTTKIDTRDIQTSN